jgi:pantoate--beta-alanine ligase
VRAARERDDHVIASIFVNPTQFGPGEDFERYPRDEERDLTLLREQGVDVAFLPTTDEMYADDASTFVDVLGVSQRLEGEQRPGHFRGVTTVVAMLFNIAQPQRAYFGRKDAQQLRVVRRLVEDLHYDIEIVGLPIVREPDGLAMSSRNAYLTPEQREAALVLSRSLRGAEALFAEGERDAGRLREAVRATLGGEPLARVDYVSVADDDTLEELERVECPAVVSIAVRIGEVRLLDNVELEPE